MDALAALQALPHGSPAAKVKAALARAGGLRLLMGMLEFGGEDGTIQAAKALCHTNRVRRYRAGGHQCIGN